MFLQSEIASLEATIKVLQIPLDKGSIDFHTTYPCIVNAINSINNVINSLKNVKPLPEGTTPF